MAFLLLGIVVTAGTAAAFGGMFSKGKFNENLEDNNVYQALEAKDYGAWLEAIKTAERKPVYADAITEDDFDTLVKIHDARVEARAERQEMHELIDDALESGDYSTWKNLVEDLQRVPPHFEDITADNFDSYVELHEAMQTGDYETVKEIREELGFPMRGNGVGQGAGRGKTMNRGMHNGQCLGQGQGRFSN